MYMDDYKRWAAAELEDPALTEELKKIEGQENEIKERFAVSLKFGTAGLRGVLGAGSNRMKIDVVRQATQGLANWVKTQGGNQLVAISYDSRINSDVFAKAIGMSRNDASYILKPLTLLGILNRVGKVANSYIYEVNNDV